MTQMPLERALEVAIGDLVCETRDRQDEPCGQCEFCQAAATLRAFMEKGLPFYEAASEWVRTEIEIVDPQTFYQPPTQKQREEVYLRARAAWFAMKEDK